MVVRPDDAIPNVKPARRVPVALKKLLLDEQTRMAPPSIIGKVEEPSESLFTLDQVRKTMAFMDDTDTCGAVGMRAAQIWATKPAPDTIREDSAIHSPGVYVCAICARCGDG
ncbi:hypothetical protein HPB52_003150 [Rhipicephalus sanguineus]|uniref:Uncharacterized protein n=1 Tax=Rhipicephalus sanguineus TaxID=34632 RepID=A0A9D4PEL1_RHISA|nr:hypothetical protein HPB52_003150 [Rhipicephalus sanguineus]